jgi:hypothetical protein
MTIQKIIEWGKERRKGEPWMTNVLLCLLGVGLVMLSRQFVREHDAFAIGFSGVSGWSATLFVAAVIVVMTLPVNRWTLWIVLGFAVGFRLMTLFAEPFLSSDIYRYVWDGMVQHAHVNPYHYVPGDKALMWLRAPNQEVFDNINRRDYARTIYPPVAQMIYWCVTFFSPTVQAMKLAMFGFECVTVWALLKMLRMMGRCSAEVLLYAWCPLLVWEIGDAGHVDAAVFCFVTLTLLMRMRDERVWVGLFLGMAVMTKFYPLVLVPALWRRGDWKMPAVMVAVAAVGYATYSSVGMLVFGFLTGYTKEEGMDTGTRYFLLEAAQKVWPGASVGMYLVFCAAVLGGISWWCWRWATVEGASKLVEGRGHAVAPIKESEPQRLKPGSADDSCGTAEAVPLTGRGDSREICCGSVGPPMFVHGALMLGFAMMLLFSPHYPWYVAWLVPFLVLVPNLPLLAYLMAFFYMFTTALADGSQKNMFVVNEILYGVTALALVLQVATMRWPVMRYLKTRES